MIEQEEQKRKQMLEQLDKLSIGPALILGAISLGTLISICPGWFGNNGLTKALRWIFIAFSLFGVVGECCSAQWKTKIFGLDDVAIGAFFCIPSALGIYLQARWWVNCIFLIPLFIGAVFIFRGMIKVAYQTMHVHAEDKKAVGQDVLVFLTKIASAALVALQIVKVWSE